MEYVLMIIVSILIVAAILILEGYRAVKEEKKFTRRLYEDYESLFQKDYSLERFAKLGSYYSRHRKPGQIDDITWNDLGMDEIFKRMDYTFSASGEEYLYHTLRSPRQNRQELEHLEEVVAFFGDHPDERVKVQLQMRKLGHTGKFSLYDYIENLDYLGERSNKKHYLMDFLYLPLIGMLWVYFSAAIIGIVVLTIYNIVSYFKEKNEIDPYIVSFAYVMRLQAVCGQLEKIDIPVCADEIECIRRHRNRLQSMRRNSFWVMAENRGNASGDILSIFMDYIRMVFHVDLIKFNSMLQVLRGHIEDVDALIGTAGFLETAVSIWLFRQSVGEEGWCRPEFTDRPEIAICGGYHPLLKDPVKNSVTAERGVLLTGSNASGKSTFLKTVALNAILAQSTNTCMASSYRASFFYIYSSMALRDDMGSGESYYIVEIRALKRILDAASAGEKPVLCFVDEVLRGTNTVERIAASTQILKSLGSAGILCFAATHDIELTELLKKDFDNYHFEEEVRDGDVFFNYRLMTGKASTRNAIRLLELMGYDEKIIERATAQAEHFLESGDWQEA
ncbi:MAG: hypothetical protein HFG25_05735 [Lachnospiraceae bacterium]|jgi:energy-coupling factor transporter ATP-binding protein EcfA2|nr:hypothetical protein [Lachnospiraceae bacterium]